ncbi:unnamed protein product [Penicillium manginii]
MALSPTSPPSSRLESLPLEVLELIFLHSLEVNLPRASPRVSNALSNQLLYTWLIRLAFSSTNPGSRDDFFTPDFLPEPLSSKFWTLSTEDRAALQTALLSCKWCTLPLFRKCQREYVHHALSRRSRDLRFAPADQKTLDNLDTLFDKSAQENFAACDKAPDARKGKGDIILPALQSPAPSSTSSACTSTSTSTTNDSLKKLAIWLNFGAIQIRPKSEIYYENTANIYRLPSPPAPITPAPIPAKLLRAPWSSSQFEFLQLLAPDFYLDEDEHAAERSGAITTRLIRQRRIGPFTVLLGMFAGVGVGNGNGNGDGNGNGNLKGKGKDGGSGSGKGDPFARVVLDERWDEIPDSVRADLLRVG